MTVHPNKFWLSSGLLLISFVYLYWRVFETLFMQWRSNVMYSHGFLIPIISLYLVWARRNRLAQIHYLPTNGFTFAALGLGIGLLLLGHVAGIQIIQGVSLIFTVTGIVCLLFGISSLKIFWLPIVYLIFMIPLWEEAITGHLHLPFQKFSAVSGIAILKLLGIPTYREGLLVILPDTVLEVARACSGINHLIAVIAIGIPLAYLFLSSWPKRFLLILIAIVIAIMSNGLRVGLIGILSYLNIGGPLHGPFHILQGLFVSFVGYVALIVLCWALSESPPSGRSQTIKNKIGSSGSTVDPPTNPSNPTNPNPHILFLAGLIFLSVGSYIHFHKFSPTPLKNRFDLFPQEIGGWTGSPANSQFSGWFKEANVDHELSRVYRENNRAGDVGVVELYIAYFESQDSKKKVINYRTEGIHQNLSIVKVDTESGQAVEMNKLIYGEKGKNKLVFFWYDIDGRIIVSRMKAKLYRAWNGLTKGQTNGAIIVLSSDLPLEGNPNGAERKMKEFFRVVYPLVSDYFPGHKLETD